MNICVVFLNKPNAGCWQNVSDNWPNGHHFILTDHMAFVASENITTTAEISDKVGIGENGALGIVFDLGAYNGYNRGELWEWINKVRS
ncbi:MAG: hypothetical protein OXE56_01990 [Gammaproteobacteria bacterium]|nr:hypothetical protein [Gammaproteobacteria bacterium]